MALKTLRNQYQGINPHLNSHLQMGGNWISFHTMHIAFLTLMLRAALRPLGYTAEVEQSAQIVRPDQPPGLPRADVAVYDPMPESRAAFSSAGALSAPIAQPLPTLLQIDSDPMAGYRAVALYRMADGQRHDLIGWVELLSPSNKPPHRAFELYALKRQELLQSGVVFVELDYLHQSPPTLETLPVYRRKDGTFHPDGLPFRIVVIDPRPAFHDGVGYIWPFRVDVPIPTATIPLGGADRLAFDFDAVYQRMYVEMAYGDGVDYRQLPAQFESYSPEDQQRIAARMIAVDAAARDGRDLEGDLPANVDPISLEVALTQIAVWN